MSFPPFFWPNVIPSNGDPLDGNSRTKLVVAGPNPAAAVNFCKELPPAEARKC
jgi:hypothetical protein